MQDGRSGSQLADSLLPTVCLDGGKETIALGPLTRTLTPSWRPHGRGPIPSQRPHLLLHLTLGVRASTREFKGRPDALSVAASMSGRGGWGGSPRCFLQESRLGLCWFLSAVSANHHPTWGATGAGAGCPLRGRGALSRAPSSSPSREGGHPQTAHPLEGAGSTLEETSRCSAHQAEARVLGESVCAVGGLECGRAVVSTLLPGWVCGPPS